MSQIFIFFFTSKTHLRSLLFFIFFSIVSCNSNSLKNKLKIDCNHATNLEKPIKIKDTKLTFETEIPSNWKRELYVNNNESRLYTADTTKELNKAYVYDFGHYTGELTLNERLIEKIRTEINSFGKSHITKTLEFKHQNKDAFLVEYSSESTHINSNSILLFLKNKNNSFYKLKIDVYGKDSPDERICEALGIFEKTILNQ